MHNVTAEFSTVAVLRTVTPTNSYEERNAKLEFELEFELGLEHEFELELELELEFKVKFERALFTRQKVFLNWFAQIHQ